MKIIIDTREQTPWSFSPEIETEIGTLKQGDYALDGDGRFAIERKSFDDFLGTISSGWGRFVRELNRMREAGFSARVIIVEGVFADCLFFSSETRVLPPNHQHFKCSPAFIMKRVAWMTMEGVSVLFCGNAEFASALASRIFIERERRLLDGTED